MILRLRDTDGYILAVESAAIVAVGVGVASDGVTGLSTLIYSIAGPILVGNPPDEVIGAWELARAEEAPRLLAHAGLIGWQQQYPDPAEPLPDPRIVQPRKGGRS